MVGGPIGYAGRNIHFGIREHAMAGIATGMALHGGILPFAATFFTFSDYMRPSIRLAALSKAHVIYVWTHDSIGLGEDGPTHQPVEQLASLRAIPDLMLLRPADANETVEAWKIAVAHTEGPVGLVLTRQKLPTLDRTYAGPGFGNGERSVCPWRLRYGFAERYPDRYRFRSVDRARSAQPTDARRNCKPGRLDAVAGICFRRSRNPTRTRFFLPASRRESASRQAPRSDGSATWASKAQSSG